MDKYELLGKIADIYAKGGNILEYLRAIEERDDNTIEDIMISYDFQAGSYNAQYRKSPDELRAYPQISNCGKIATKGGGKNGEKELQVMDNIRCVLGGRKG